MDEGACSKIGMCIGARRLLDCIWIRSGNNFYRENSAEKNYVPILILPGEIYSPVQLGVETYIDRCGFLPTQRF